MQLSDSLSLENLIVSVAVPRPLPGLFTYKIPPALLSLIQVGGWVKVPFGRTVTHAFVVEAPRAASEIPLGITLEMLRDILEVSDPEYLLSSDVLSLCRWAHEYYFVPLGEMLNCAAPAAAMGLKKLKRGSRPVVSSICASVSSVSLTEDQLKAVEEFDSIRLQSGGRVALLQGVTGSGKTEVYIEIARRTLSAGKGVIILVPEIALTSQLHRRFEESLGECVGLWHSAVSDGKRRDQSVALRTGSLRVVVGARSAVFAPVKDLGLIVVDEEHDPTYKQEDRVRYHARDLAVVRAKFSQAFVILGSATPSLETRERVNEGRYSISKLDRRISKGGLPQIEWVDLRTETQVKATQTPLAVKTIRAIQEAVLSGEQVIVYLNRRGFAAFLLCKECGEVKGCPSCSISLTLHKRACVLRCHVCGYDEPIPDTCEKCHGIDLHPMGAGTESLEDELTRLVSGAKVSRLDRDQVTSATRLDKILNAFRKGQTNILLGTQMLVKGHDFPGVTLVVVVMADALFRWPDFRSPERAFQILKQVSGRAGRGEKSGKVLIQTFDTDHEVLQVIDGRISEESFIENERQLRKALGYPPFGRLARLRFEGSSREEAAFHASSVARQLSTATAELDLLGPSEAFLEKAKNVYRWDIVLKSKNIQTLQKAVSQARSYSAARKWSFIADIDPHGI